MHYLFLFLTIVANLVMFFDKGMHEMMAYDPAGFLTGAVINNVVLVVCVLIVRGEVRAHRELADY